MALGKPILLAEGIFWRSLFCAERPNMNIIEAVCPNRWLMMKIQICFFSVDYFNEVLGWYFEFRTIKLILGSQSFLPIMHDVQSNILITEPTDCLVKWWYLVVIHDSVEWLNPHRINVSVQDDPLGVFSWQVGLLPHDHGKQPWKPSFGFWGIGM